MASLTPAHRGYEYQDLLVACRLVDMLLDTVTEAHVDSKLVENDRFDDLTVKDPSGRWERAQFKHTDTADSPLKLKAFTSDARGLQLDRLVSAALAFRDGPGAGTPSIQLRVVVRDVLPVDADLSSVLKLAISDPGPFLAGMATTRLCFSVDALWPPAGQGNSDSTEDDTFAFLRTGEGKVDRADLAWLCDHLLVEVGAASMSMDLQTLVRPSNCC